MLSAVNQLTTERFYLFQKNVSLNEIYLKVMRQAQMLPVLPYEH